MAKKRGVAKVKASTSSRKASARGQAPAQAAGDKKQAEKVSASVPSKTREKNANTSGSGVGTCLDKLEATVEKLFRCITCKKEWSQPTGLPCGHVFCGECLKNNQPSTSRAATRSTASSSISATSTITCEICHFKVGRRAVFVRRTDLETFLPLIKRLVKSKPGTTDKQAEDEHITVICPKSNQVEQIVENNVEEDTSHEPTPEAVPIMMAPPPPGLPSQIDDIRLSASQQELLLSDEKENMWDGIHAKDATPTRVHYSIDDLAVAVQMSQDDEPDSPDQVEHIEDMETEVSDVTGPEVQMPPVAVVKSNTKDRSMFETEIAQSMTMKEGVPASPAEVPVIECHCNGKKLSTKDSSTQTDNVPSSTPPRPAVNREQPPDQNRKFSANHSFAHRSFGGRGLNKDKFIDQPLDLSMSGKISIPIRQTRTCALTFFDPLDLSNKKSRLEFNSCASRKKIFNPVAVRIIINEAPGYLDGKRSASAPAFYPCMEKRPSSHVATSAMEIDSGTFCDTGSKMITSPSMSRKRPLNECENENENEVLRASRNQNENDVVLLEEFADVNSNHAVSNKETKKVKTKHDESPPPSQASSATYFDPASLNVGQPEEENFVSFSTPKREVRKRGLKRQSTVEVEGFPSKDDHDTSLDSMDKQMLNFNTMAFLADDKPSLSPSEKVPDVILEEMGEWHDEDNEDEADDPDFLPATPNQKSQSILVVPAPEAAENGETPSQILKKMNEDYEKRKKLRPSSVFPNPTDFEMDELVSSSITRANVNDKIKIKMLNAPELGTSKCEVQEQEIDQVSEKNAMNAVKIAASSKRLVFCPTRLNAVQEFDLRTLCEKTGSIFQRNYSTEVTHLIVDLVDSRVPHTMKYFSAIAQKKWILVFDWVKECLKHDGLVNEEPWETSCFRNCDRGPRKSRLSSGSLFHDVTFFVGHKFSQSGISAAECRNLLVLFGGKVVYDPADATENILLIGDPHDQSFDYNMWYKRKGWLTVTWEWVTDCILSYSVLPFTETGLLTSNLNISRIRLPLGISDELCTLEH